MRSLLSAVTSARSRGRSGSAEPSLAAFHLAPPSEPRQVRNTGLGREDWERSGSFAEAHSPFALTVQKQFSSCERLLLTFQWSSLAATKLSATR
jgi:hypothetical protein